MPDCIKENNCSHIDSRDEIMAMKAEHKVLATYKYDPTIIEKGYNNRSLYISVGGSYDTSAQDPLIKKVVGENGVVIGEKAVTQQMKKKFVGGKGFDLYHLWKAVKNDTKWDNPENEIVISPGPLAGITQYPGAGKSLVCTISPITSLPVDSNVGGYFGPYMKFSGFDALELQGKSDEELIIFIDGDNHTISVETAPLEAFDSHILGEQLSEMYSTSDNDKKNISIVSSGRAAEDSNIGLLNFSFWDLRRNCLRLKQAGRGGIGTVFRNKKIKALVVKFSGTHGELNNPVKKNLLNEAGLRLHREMTHLDHKQNRMRDIGTANIIEVMDQYDLLPVHNFQYGMHPETPKIASKVFIEKYVTQNVPDGCWYGCSMSCAKAVDNFELRTGPYKGHKVYVDGPEYENAGALGSNVGVFDPRWILEANFYCDTYALDTISMGTMTAFAMECFQRGLYNLDDTEGLDMRWGNGFTLNELMHQMVAGEGFGMIIGKGIRQQKRIFAERFGKVAPEYEYMLKGRKWSTIDVPEEKIALTALTNPDLADCQYLKDVSYDDEAVQNKIKNTPLSNPGAANDSAWLEHPKPWDIIEGIPTISRDQIADWPVGKPYYSDDPECSYTNGRPWVKMTDEQVAFMNDIGMENKGLEYSEYLMKESLAQQGGYALCNKGPQHDEAWLIFMDMVNNQIPTFEDKAEALHFFPMFRTWFGLLGLCKLPWNDVTPEDNKYEKEPAKIPAHIRNYLSIYEGVTGEPLDEESMIVQSERVYTFQRCFILRMGSGQRKHDTPPIRSLGPITREEYLSREERYDKQILDNQGIDVTGKSIDEKIEIIMKYRKEQFRMLVDAVYKRRGWTPNGILKLEKLISIGMDIPELVRTVRPYLKEEGFWPKGPEYAKYDNM